MEIMIPQITMNIPIWLMIYIGSFFFNFMRMGICRCGDLIPKGLLISFIPFPLTDLLMMNNKVSNWVYKE